MPEYSKEQLKTLYENLPKELQTAMYSEKNAENIKRACENSGVSGPDEIFNAAKNIGYVFLGLLPPDNLPLALQKDLQIEAGVAGQISGEIANSIFLPVKKTLENLYGIKIEIQPLKPAANINIEKGQEIKGKDGYREAIQ